MKKQNKIIKWLGVILGFIFLGLASTIFFADQNADINSGLILGGAGMLFLILSLSSVGDIDIYGSFYNILGLNKDIPTPIPQQQNKINPLSRKIGLVFLSFALLTHLLGIYNLIPKNTFIIIFPPCSLIGAALFFKSGGPTIFKNKLTSARAALLLIISILAITLSIYKTWGNTPWGFYDFIGYAGWIGLIIIYRSILKNSPSFMLNTDTNNLPIDTFFKKYDFWITLAFGILVTAIIAGVLIYAPELLQTSLKKK